MKLTKRQANTLKDMADWLEEKATENWDGFDEQQVKWFLDNAKLIRMLVNESEGSK